MYIANLCLIVLIRQYESGETKIYQFERDVIWAVAVLL
jgi:hypothetical protein